jgi:hypothetical protein
MTYYKPCPLPEVEDDNDPWTHWQHGECVEMYVVPVEGLLIEHPEKEERTWYCARFGQANHEPDICERYGHLADGQGCSWRLLIVPPLREGRR